MKLPDPFVFLIAMGFYYFLWFAFQTPYDKIFIFVFAILVAIKIDLETLTNLKSMVHFINRNRNGAD